MKRLILLFIFLLLPVSAWSAAITSKALTGNLSTATNWVGDVAPVNGDTIIVVNGADITIDVDISLGSNASAVGHAFNVNGVSTSSYGILRIATGITVTLAGYDLTTNTLGLVARYGKFLPYNATVLFSLGSDYKSIILNKGILDAVGTTFQAVPADISWSNFGGAATTTSLTTMGVGKYYNEATTRWLNTIPFRNCISNAAKNNIGSFGDSSLVFTGATDSGGNILINEVSSKNLVLARGDYFVDYNNGIVFFTRVVNDVISAGSASNFQLQYYSAGISSIQNTTYNQATFDGCTFRYMGSHSFSLAGGSGEALVVSNKYVDNIYSTFSLINSTIERCGRFLYISASYGNSTTRMPITGNTIRWCEGGWPGGVTRPIMSSVPGTSNYIDFSNNILDIGSSISLLYTAPLAGSGLKQIGWRISGNTGQVSSLFYGGFGSSTTSSVSWENLVITGNVLTSFGVSGANAINTIGTMDESKGVKIHSNYFENFFRIINVGSNIEFYDNILKHAAHHGLYTAYSDQKYKLVNVDIRNNLFTGEYIDAGFLHIGYKNQLWIDNIRVFQNTFFGSSSVYATGPGAIGLGDPVDNDLTTLATNVSIHSNIIINNSIGIRARASDTTSSRTKLHVKILDYNAMYQVGAEYYNLNGQMQPIQAGINYNLSVTRNIPGVAIRNADYTMPESMGRTLAYDATAKTLTWGSGDAVSILMSAQNAGTVTSFSSGELATTVNDTARNWSADNTTTTSPNSFWFHNETTSAVHAVVWRGTATQITIVPAAVGMANGNTYSIYKSEVRLYDSPGSTGNYIDVGIVFGDLPTTSQSDTEITFTKSYLTTNPSLKNIGDGTFDGATPANPDYKTSGYLGSYVGAVEPVALSGAAAALMGF